MSTSSPDVIVTPHFGWPFTFSPETGVAVVEQDSLDEIMANVRLIVSCPLGAWLDVPSFGVPSPLFAQAPVNTSGIEQAIVQWEPRAVTTAREYPDAFNDATRNIVVNVSTAQADQ